MRNWPLEVVEKPRTSGRQVRSSSTLTNNRLSTVPAEGGQTSKHPTTKKTEDTPNYLRRTHYRCSTLQAESIYSGSIENYQFLRTVGKGAYAIVREAVHLPTKQLYAIKSYDKVRLADPAKKRNVMREIKVLKKLDHPNIVKCREAVDDAKQIHIVMEYIEGIPLCSYIKRFPLRKIPQSEARRIFCQLLQTLQYCHSKKVAHRDIKLDNVLIDRQNNVKLVDFGFATYSPLPSRTFCGTPSYMAPEIILKKEYVGAPADMWALGVLLFVMLNGAFPFKGTNDRDLYRKIVRGVFEIPESTPARYRTLLQALIQVCPENRPTADSLVSEEWISTATASIEPTPAYFSKTEEVETHRRGYSKRRYSLMHSKIKR